MDLNQLYFDHQISLMRADNSGNLGIRDAHLNNAAVTAQHIEFFQRSRNAPAFSGWEIRYRSDDQPWPSERRPWMTMLQ